MSRKHLEIQIDFAFNDLLNAARQQFPKGRKAVITDEEFALYDALRRVEALSEAIGWLDLPDEDEGQTEDAVGQAVDEAIREANR